MSDAARTQLSRLVRAAQQRLRDAGVYRAELSHWRRPHPDRVRHPSVGWPAAETVPLRDFGLVTPFRGGAGVPEDRYPALRARLTDPARGGWPQVILLLGYARPTSPAPRRDVAEVLLA